MCIGQGRGGRERRSKVRKGMEENKKGRTGEGRKRKIRDDV